MSLQQPTSNYIPICLFSSEESQKSQRRFYFEIDYSKVHDLIVESWTRQTGMQDEVDNLCRKLRRLRRVLQRRECCHYRETCDQKDEILKRDDEIGEVRGSSGTNSGGEC